MEKNNLLMQFQADIINKSVLRPECVETTAIGAAYLAGLAVGFWDGMEEIINKQKTDREFTPAMTDADRREKLGGWHRAVSAALGWSESSEQGSV